MHIVSSIEIVPSGFFVRSRAARTRAGAAMFAFFRNRFTFFFERADFRSAQGAEDNKPKDDPLQLCLQPLFERLDIESVHRKYIFNTETAAELSNSIAGTVSPIKVTPGLDYPDTSVIAVVWLSRIITVPVLWL